MFGVKQLRTVSSFFWGGYVSSMTDFGRNISRCARGGDISIICMYFT